MSTPAFYALVGDVELPILMPCARDARGRRLHWDDRLEACPTMRNDMALVGGCCHVKSSAPLRRLVRGVVSLQFAIRRATPQRIPSYLLTTRESIHS